MDLSVSHMYMSTFDTWMHTHTDIHTYFTRCIVWDLYPSLKYYMLVTARGRKKRPEGPNN